MLQRIFILIGLIGFFNSSFQISNGYAQGGSISDKEIVVEKEKEVKLKPANKGVEKIQPIKPQKEINTLSYPFLEPFFKPDALKLSLKSPKIPTESNPDEDVAEKELRGFLKAGGGNYGTTFVQGFFQHRITPAILYGLDLQHLASKRGEVAEEYSGASDNTLKLFGKYLGDNSTWNASMGYQRNLVRYYGYNPLKIENLSIDTLKKRYSRFQILLNNSSNDATASLQYEYGIHFINLNDNFDANEIQFGLTGKSNYQINDQIHFLLNGQIWLTKIKDAINKNRNYIRFQPQMQFQTDWLRLEAGVIVAYQTKMLVEPSEEKDFILYPSIQANVQINEKINVFADFEGDLQRNTLNQFARENPFIGKQVALFNTNQLWNTQLGVKANLLRGLSATFQAGYGKFQDLAFYGNSLQDSARFSLLFEREKSNLLKLEAQLYYQPSEKWNLKLQATSLNYDLATLAEPFHQPTFKANLMGNFKPIPSLTFSLDGQLLGGIKARNFITDKNFDLKTIIDISFKTDFVFLDNFSTFFAINNIFAGSYQRFLYYPTQKLNFLIGLAYGF